MLFVKIFSFIYPKGILLISSGIEVGLATFDLNKDFFKSMLALDVAMIFL